MLRRDMSTTPPLGEALPRKNKFVGESFGVPNVRTIYAGAEEDRLNKDSRVILLVGPSGAGKSSLIDFLCNYFYGATLEGNDRYHIANEKFDGSTPEKSIITYVFNDAYMEYRPIVVDTPATGRYHDEECSRLMEQWLEDNSRMRIDLIGVVISCTVRMSTEEEFQLQKTLDLFPTRLHKNMAVFLTGSDGSPKPEALLRRFGLQDCKVFKVNTSCLFQAPLDDRLQEHLRGTYWRMTTGHFTDLTFQLRLMEPQTMSGAPPEVTSNSSRLSSGSSSINTVIQRDPGHRTFETKTTSSVSGKTVTTATTVDHSRTTEEKTIVHPPVLKPLHPSFPPPPPPPPEFSGAQRESGLPSSLLDDIRNRRRDSRDDVVVVEYELSQPEVVVLHNSPKPPDSPPRDLPPPLSLSRPYDIPPSEFYKTVTTHASGTTTRFSSSSECKEGTRVTAGSVGALARYDEPPKTYAHETTPPLPESTTYSTRAYMNDNGTVTTDQMKTYVSRSTEGKAYSPYERTPVQDTTPVIMRTPATPRTPSLSQQLRYSFPDLERSGEEEAVNRSQSTRQPTEPQGDVTRYVYDVGSRSHKSHVVGVRTSARSSARNSYDFEGRKRESRSLETISRAAADNEAFYSASGFTINRRSMNSLHALNHYENALELVAAEDMYAFIDPVAKLPIKPKQSPRTVTVINDPSPDVSFSRNDDHRKSIRTPPQHPPQQPIQIPVQPQTPVQTPGAPVPARRKSQEKKNEDRRSGVYPPPTNVDGRENPAYSVIGGVPLRDQPGRKGHGDQVSQELRDRERMLNETRNNVNRGSYPYPADRNPTIGSGAQPNQQGMNGGRYQNIGNGVQPSPPQNQQPPGSQHRNDFMIPADMRNGKGPIEVTIGMKHKEHGKYGETYNGYHNEHQQQNGKYAPPPQLPPHQYRDGDYGDDWDGQSSVTRRVEEQREQIHGRGREQQQVQRRPPNLQIGEGALVSNGVNNMNDPRSPAPPPYPNRQYPSTPDAKGGQQGAGGGDESDAEQGLVPVDHRRGLLKGKESSRVGGYVRGKENYGYTQNGKRTKTITKEETTTVTERRRQPRVKVLNWNPCNCGTTRDCLLNIICFIIAPLFVIAVIITIIVISITNK